MVKRDGREREIGSGYRRDKKEGPERESRKG